jgi:hypothetical protein
MKAIRLGQSAAGATRADTANISSGAGYFHVAGLVQRLEGRPDGPNHRIAGSTVIGVLISGWFFVLRPLNRRSEVLSG